MPFFARAFVETVLHSFDSVSTAEDGQRPETHLIQGSDGNFYGTSYYGGTAGSGTIFKMKPNGVVTILHSFGDGSVANDGLWPQAALIQGSDGNFHGTTTGGGSTFATDPNRTGYGTAYKMTPSGVVMIPHSFNDGSTTSDGYWPAASVIEGNDGNFYGTSPSGGITNTTYPNGSGTVFKMTPSGVVTTLHIFNDGSVSRDGSYPLASLIQRSDGPLHTMTSEGGQTGGGTIFKLTLGGSFTVLHSFQGGPDSFGGLYPTANLVQGSDGNFYGTTFYGSSGTLIGVRGYGTVFQMIPDRTVTPIHSFNDGSVANDGQNPSDGLIEGSDGNLYGTASQGGSASQGLVFRITTSGAVTILHSFGDGSVTNDGAGPMGGMIQAANDNFYTTTGWGGSAGWGTIIRLAVPAPVKSLCLLPSIVRGGRSSIATLSLAWPARNGGQVVDLRSHDMARCNAMTPPASFVSIVVTYTSTELHRCVIGSSRRLV